MPRASRLIAKGERSVYHVISRTALDGFPFGDAEKDMLVKIIKRFSSLYFTEVLGFCVMGNHFHLLVRMLPDSDHSNADIIKRMKAFYGKEIAVGKGQIPLLREKLSSLSEYVREIKQGFTRYYNKRHHRKGFLWGERFKSVMVENGETLVNCLAYIDLNPVRAGLVETPEAYRWNSIGFHAQTKNKNDFLSLDFGLKTFGATDRERLRQYRRFVHEKGGLSGKGVDAGTSAKDRGQDYESARMDRFRCRTRYFTDSGIIGSKEFVKEQYMEFRGTRAGSKEKTLKRVSGLDGIYSLKRLSEYKQKK